MIGLLFYIYMEINLEHVIYNSNLIPDNNTKIKIRWHDSYFTTLITTLIVTLQ